MEPKPQITIEDFAKLDLRAATVLAAEVHPNADRLLKLQVDLGFEQRQICAGVRQFVNPETLVGRQIVVVANLKERAIRGELSAGMLLAVSVMGDDQLLEVVLLHPDKPVPNGSVVG